MRITVPSWKLWSSWKQSGQQNPLSTFSVKAASVAPEVQDVRSRTETSVFQNSPHVFKVVGIPEASQTFRSSESCCSECESRIYGPVLTLVPSAVFHHVELILRFHCFLLVRSRIFHFLVFLFPFIFGGGFTSLSHLVEIKVTAVKKCTIHIYFVLFVFLSDAPQSLNRVWEKRETWGLKVRSPPRSPSVGFRLSWSGRAPPASIRWLLCFPPVFDSCVCVCVWPLSIVACAVACQRCCSASMFSPCSLTRTPVYIQI